MTPWYDDLIQRTRFNEGVRPIIYRDSFGNRTIGVGFNLERPDARELLLGAGVPRNGLDAIFSGEAALTDNEINTLLLDTLLEAVGQARATLPSGIFDALSDARRAAVADLVFNLGQRGWMLFGKTRELIVYGQSYKSSGDAANAQKFFEAAADHLLASDYAKQVGARARRNAEMIRTSAYVPFDQET